jgi:sulfur relay (sulfurtransferase) complex TusBCD TusD component (DsrE family)
MRRGCISLGNIKCDICQRTILYPERYLSLEESKSNTMTICISCCAEKGLVKSESAKDNTESVFNLSTD